MSCHVLVGELYLKSVGSRHCCAVAAVNFAFADVLSVIKARFLLRLAKEYTDFDHGTVHTLRTELTLQIRDPVLNDVARRAAGEGRKGQRSYDLGRFGNPGVGGRDGRIRPDRGNSLEAASGGDAAERLGTSDVGADTIHVLCLLSAILSRRMSC
eukprot:2063828-Rhodomonas_salina.3